MVGGGTWAVPTPEAGKDPNAMYLQRRSRDSLRTHHPLADRSLYHLAVGRTPNLARTEDMTPRAYRGGYIGVSAASRRRFGSIRDTQYPVPNTRLILESNARHRRATRLVDSSSRGIIILSDGRVIG